jgi:hypothetical protein
MIDVAVWLAYSGPVDGFPHTTLVGRGNQKGIRCGFRYRDRAESAAVGVTVPNAGAAPATVSG